MPTPPHAKLAPRAGFEPATCRLTVGCSTAELPGKGAMRVAASSNIICALPSAFNTRGIRRLRYRRDRHMQAPLHWATLRRCVPMPTFQIMAQTLKIGSFAVSLPRNRAARIAMGTGLLLGGVLGFLPILGFWMIPLGLMVLGQDIPAVRRVHRKLAVRFGRWRQSRAARRKSGLAHGSGRA